jgi:alpha-tubulin suppressor-like RCC1 family protein
LGLPPIQSVDAMYAFALALDYDGNVWTWGQHIQSDPTTLHIPQQGH